MVHEATVSTGGAPLGVGQLAPDLGAGSDREAAHERYALNWLPWREATTETLRCTAWYRAIFADSTQFGCLAVTTRPVLPPRVLISQVALLAPSEQHCA